MKLFIGVPVTSHVPWQFLQAMLSVPRLPFDVMVSFAPHGGIGLARNKLAAAFLRSDCTHILFIDSDMIFEIRQILRIVSHQESIVGGIYHYREPGPARWVVTAVDDSDPLSSGLKQVSHIGAGFLLVKRDVFEALKTKEIQYSIGDDPEWDFFPMGLIRGVYTGEDIAFLQSCQAAGFKVWADTKIIVPHLGATTFPIA